MPAAVFVSPHLDDVAFSCAEPVLAMRERGWEVTVATVFTATVESPTGFALACQLDKGVPEGVDYMALRREEDRAFANRLGVACRQLDLPEAPHRGYESVAALFGEVRDDDPATGEVGEALRELFAEVAADVCFSPIGIGGHVDHGVVVAALADALGANPPLVSLRYADQPYALRNPLDAAGGIAALEAAIPLRFATLARRRREAAAAVDEYASQIGFQFGDTPSMHAALERISADGTPFWCERGSIAELDDFTVPARDTSPPAR